MFRCPICQHSLNASQRYPYAPICSEACRREAMRRAGVPVPARPGSDASGRAGDETASPDSNGGAAQFDQLKATHLYCQTCRRSMPTKERLLLMLPTGSLYGYTCEFCGSDVGTKAEK